MGPEELHVLGTVALSIIDSDVGLVAFSTMLAGGACVVAGNVSAMCPAIVVVGKFSRRPGR